MTKVTSKFQVTVPKALADRYGIAPGDDLIWEAAGETLRVRPTAPRARYALDGRERLRLFDAATRRQAVRQSRRDLGRNTARDWTRDSLNERDVHTH